MTHLADPISRLGTESAFDVLSRARALEAQGKSIIHLEIGEPDFDTPRHVIEAAKKALGRRLHALRADAGDSGLPEGDCRVCGAHAIY